MENHHAINGKIHYFYGHGFNSYFDITRGYPSLISQSFHWFLMVLKLHAIGDRCYHQAKMALVSFEPWAQVFVEDVRDIVDTILLRPHFGSQNEGTQYLSRFFLIVGRRFA